MIEIARSTFGSLIPAIVTPFDADGCVDVVAMEALVDNLVTRGCDGIVVSGTTGESPTTSQVEKDELVRVAKSAAGGRARIIAGAGSNNTAHAVEMAEHAVQAGADALLVVSPYYNRPTQKGLVAHVETITNATDLPVMLYDIPGRTGLAFGDEALDQLAAHPQIVALKDATGNVEQGLERSRRTGLAYYSGDDGLNFDWMRGGAAGFVSIATHLVPEEYVHMIAALDSGDEDTAREIARRVQPIVDALFVTGQGTVMAKAALAMQGLIPSATVRLPLVEADASELQGMEKALKDLGLL